MTVTKLDATGQHWVAKLANYSFTLKYKPGKCNIEADALSRMPSSEIDYWISIGQAEVGASLGKKPTGWMGSIVVLFLIM